MIIIVLSVFISLGNCTDEAERKCKKSCDQKAKICLLPISDPELKGKEGIVCTLLTGFCLNSCCSHGSSSSSGKSSGGSWSHSSGGGGH